jgi:quercetin dioxygenase-like cupin family protein
MSGERKTSFGYMNKCDIGGLLVGKFEVMAFRKHGKFHSHDVDEIAVCAHGSGDILTERADRKVYLQSVSAGGYVVIPAGVKHAMFPRDTGMEMVILYRPAAKEQE